MLCCVLVCRCVCCDSPELMPNVNKKGKGGGWRAVKQKGGKGSRGEGRVG